MVLRLEKVFKPDRMVLRLWPSLLGESELTKAPAVWRLVVRMQHSRDGREQCWALHALFHFQQKESIWRTKSNCLEHGFAMDGN